MEPWLPPGTLQVTTSEGSDSFVWLPWYTGARTLTHRINLLVILSREQSVSAGVHKKGVCESSLEGPQYSHMFFTAVEMVVSGQVTCKYLVALHSMWLSISLWDITYCKMGFSRQLECSLLKNTKTSIAAQFERQ